MGALCLYGRAMLDQAELCISILEKPVKRNRDESDVPAIEKATRRACEEPRQGQPFEPRKERRPGFMHVKSLGREQSESDAKEIAEKQ